MNFRTMQVRVQLNLDNIGHYFGLRSCSRPPCENTIPPRLNCLGQEQNIVFAKRDAGLLPGSIGPV